MSDQVLIMDLLKKEVWALLIAVKEGLTPVQLDREYKSMIGKPLPLHKLGYRSIMELVTDMPDVVCICHYGDGSVVLKAIADETTKGIARLVARQKSSSKVQHAMHRPNAFRSSSFSPRLIRPGQTPSILSRRGRTPPILPAVVKSELKDLLRLSPVLLTDFDKAFTQRFGREFQYMRYGFFSMFEVLTAASDIIVVEQTRAGSLLILKKNPSVNKQQENLSKGEAILFNGLGKTVLISMYLMSISGRLGAGGTVCLELKEKIRTVSVKNKFLCSLISYRCALFKNGSLLVQAQFKEKLPVKELGFLNIVELVGALNDVLHLECKEGDQDWLIFDIESTCLTVNNEISLPDSLVPIQPEKQLDFSCWECRPEISENLELERRDMFSVITKMVKPHLGMEEQQLTQEIMKQEIPPDAVHDRNLFGLLPLDSNHCLLGVFVEYIISPSQFFLRLYSKEISEMLEDMMIEMRRCYSNKNVSDRYVMPEASIQPGQLCCARISKDKWWYRVIVHRVLSEEEVEVFFPDFGNMGVFQKSLLRFLKCCYTKLPAQAIPCSLSRVKPLEGHWTTNAILRFQRFCSLKPLVGVVDEYMDGVLYLFLCDTTSDEDVYLHDVLRAEGHVVICSENIPSQVKEGKVVTCMGKSWREGTCAPPSLSFLPCSAMVARAGSQSPGEQGTTRASATGTETPAASGEAPQGVSETGPHPAPKHSEDMPVGFADRGGFPPVPGEALGAPGLIARPHVRGQTGRKTPATLDAVQLNALSPCWDLFVPLLVSKIHARPGW
uniref:Tudor domain-containing protein 5 n=1 Tax=Sphenodon punctatus TaxID=8508 RepID=A0A8D0HPE6_SPHPU